MATPSPPCLPHHSNYSLLKPNNFIPLHFFPFLFLLISLPYSFSLSFHCPSPLPLPSPNSLSPPFPSSFFSISAGFFSGGSPLFAPDSPPLPSRSSPSSSFSFFPKSIRQTDSPPLLRISGTLILRGTPLGPRNRSLLHLVKPRLPRPLYRRSSVSFDLDGVWSEPDSILCMSGPGITLGFNRFKQGNSLHLSGVLKLNFSKSFNLSSPFITGTLESSDETSNPNYFEPISLLSYAVKNYGYTQIERADSICPHVNVDGKFLRDFNGNFSCARLGSLLEAGFKMEYGKNCSNGDCVPLRGTNGFDQDYMFLDQVDCTDDGKIHMYLVFSNRSRLPFHSFVIGEKSVVAEGIWDRELNRLCLVGCSVLLSEEGSRKNLTTGDCPFGLSFWFPLSWSITSRSVALGQIWGETTEGQSGNFSIVPFRSTENYMTNLVGLNYEYTKLEIAKKFCPIDEQKRTKSGDKYPDGKYFRDLRFQFGFRNRDQKSDFGFASPVSIGQFFFGVVDPGDSTTKSEFNQSLLNISYKIQYTINNVPDQIWAEGMYNKQTGSLCLVGCKQIGSSDSAKKARVNNSMDCEIFMSVKFSSLNGKSREHLWGMVSSLRDKSDPLFFKPWDIVSYGIYTTQAAESIWRMDIEITMVLVSLTLSCIFLGLQLYYVRKNPNFLSSVSFIMLVILVLGHMIPLVLNFEALFVSKKSKQSVFFSSRGWLEVNEVVIRVLTMVAFLLQLRFLQVAFSARSENERKFGSWVAERKTLLICLPFYLFGVILAWFFHVRNNNNNAPKSRVFAQRHTIWEDLMSYAGLILDGFLLPQIIFNIFLDVKEKTLANSFYLGFTFVRALPHAYDAYRARNYIPGTSSSYIYANPSDDIFTLAWDIVVPIIGIIFSAILFLQQKFGGSFFLPMKMRRSSEYEMVPVTTSS